MKMMMMSLNIVVTNVVKVLTKLMNTKMSIVVICALIVLNIFLYGRLHGRRGKEQTGRSASTGFAATAAASGNATAATADTEVRRPRDAAATRKSAETRWSDVVAVADVVPSSNG